MSEPSASGHGRAPPRRRTPRGPFALAATALVAVTLIPLAVGVALDVYALLYWGVLSAYLGLSWIAPGALLGVAAAQRAERSGGRLINTAGISVGVLTAVTLLVAVATLLAVGAVDENESAAQDPVPSVPAVTDPPRAQPELDRVALVTEAARTTGRGKIVRVSCSTGVLRTCAVTFDGPSCGLWIINESDSGPRAIALGLPIEGARAAVSSNRASCRK